jgi:uncharacterized protein (TIGR02117 family)
MNRRAALAALIAAPLVPRTARAAASIVVTSNGWHSGIALPRPAVPETIIPEAADFPAAAWLEFGWGDAEYYPTPRPTAGLALSAAFPGPAVLHVSGLPGHPAQTFPTVEVFTFALTPAQHGPLLAALAASFERRGGARAQPLAAPGLYAFSRFYPATGRFHAFNTCNTWTARILAAAGLPISPGGIHTADELVARLRPLASGP